MNRIFFWILLVSALSLQGATRWKYQYQFELKKDQTAKIKISFRDKKMFLRNGLFTFRWTLYKNKALTVFSSYQKVKAQHILYKGYRLGSFGVELLPIGSTLTDRVYLLVVFRDFDKKKGIAKIDMFIQDTNAKILADFIDPNRKGNNVR